MILHNQAIIFLCRNNIACAQTIPKKMVYVFPRYTQENGIRFPWVYPRKWYTFSLGIPKKMVYVFPRYTQENGIRLPWVYPRKWYTFSLGIPKKMVYVFPGYTQENGIRFPWSLSARRLKQHRSNEAARILNLINGSFECNNSNSLNSSPNWLNAKFYNLIGEYGITLRRHKLGPTFHSNVMSPS